MRNGTFIVCAAVLMAAGDAGADGALHIASGDSAHGSFDDVRARECYLAAVREGANNYEALWKLARSCIDMGERAVDKASRKNLFSEGTSYAREATRANPQGAQGYLQYGIGLGRLALDTTSKEKVRMAKEIRTAFETCLEYDPQNDYALHALGRWHREMATLSWLEKTFADMFLGGIPKDVSVSRADEYFRRAIAINPGHINHHYERGKTLELLKRPEEAIGEYETALALPKRDADDARYKKEAEERLVVLRK
jgi:tetratricopeptide (TPR) repeat protein